MNLFTAAIAVIGLVGVFDLPNEFATGENKTAWNFSTKSNWYIAMLPINLVIYFEFILP